MTVRPVPRADCEHQSPLPEKRSVRREKRVAWIVDAGCFRSGAVELDDLEVASLFEVFLVLVANVVSPDKEAWQAPGNLIDRTLQRVRVKMHSIAKNAALRVITSFHEF